MASNAEGKHRAEFVQSLANNNRSIENITIKSGQNVAAGEVLSKELTGAATSAAAAGNTGNGTMGSVTVGDQAKVGDYILTIVEPGSNVGDFTLADPNGVQVGTGDVAGAFSGEISFTLADGGTDFAAGDSFTISVTLTSEVYTALPNDASEEAVAIALDNYDATSAAKDGAAVVRDAEVNDAELTWPSGQSAANKTVAQNQLKDNGVIFR